LAAFFLKKTSVTAINITLGVPGRRADETLEQMEGSGYENQPITAADATSPNPPSLIE
jgi:hypothetical protein